MQILVTTPSHGTVALDVEGSDSIQNVKQRLEAITGTPVADQVLHHDGTELADNRTLADYAIERDDTLVLTVASTGSDPDPGVDTPTSSIVAPPTVEVGEGQPASPVPSDELALTGADAALFAVGSGIVLLGVAAVAVARRARPSSGRSSSRPAVGRRPVERVE